MSSLATMISPEFIRSAFNSLQQLTTSDDSTQNETAMLWLKQHLDTLLGLPIYVLTSEPNNHIAHAFSPVITIRDRTDAHGVVKSDHLILASPYPPNDEKLHNIKGKSKSYQQVSFLFLITQLFNAVHSQLDNVSIVLESAFENASEPSQDIMLRSAHIQKLSQTFFEVEAAAKTDLSKQLWSKIATKKLRAALYDIGLQHERIKTIQCWAFGAICYLIIDGPKSQISAMEINIKNQLTPVIDQPKIMIKVQHITEVQSDAMAQYMLEKTNTTVYDHLWHHFSLFRWFKNSRNMAALVFDVQQNKD